MVKFTFAAILAASVAAPVLGAAISFDRLETRDVANTDSELFGRAVAEVFNDLYSREELSELMERDIEEFTARDLAELMEREFDVDESLITRDLLDAAEDLDARAPIFGWIKKKLGFGTPAPPPPPRQPNIIEKFLNLFRNKNHPGAKKAAAAKKAGGQAPAAPAAPAAEAPAAEAPAARDFYDEDLLEREYEDFVFERDFDEDVFERDFDEDVYERDYEDVFERDYEFDELD
ncbi:hypothetical protein BKA70DRAFT_46743 [Coprinopsis sp. MPI-PUGE-AT-0042]|nr:hypothetical protein BKA70DRAFT_46743 [Coprinopsis sp. MPI-PUGE-AT-0042]